VDRGEAQDPRLAVMHDNRAYHQEVMHVQRLSNFRNRVANLGGAMGPVGTSIENPGIEYHKLAESMGWWARGRSRIRHSSAPRFRKPRRWIPVKSSFFKGKIVSTRSRDAKQPAPGRLSCLPNQQFTGRPEGCLAIGQGGVHV